MLIQMDSRKLESIGVSKKLVAINRKRFEPNKTWVWWSNYGSPGRGTVVCIFTHNMKNNEKIKILDWFSRLQRGD
jgi:hypothetical protein